MDHFMSFWVFFYQNFILGHISPCVIIFIFKNWRRRAMSGYPSQLCYSFVLINSLGDNDHRPQSTGTGNTQRIYRSGLVLPWDQIIDLWLGYCQGVKISGSLLKIAEIVLQWKNVSTVGICSRYAVPGVSNTAIYFRAQTSNKLGTVTTHSSTPLIFKI
jgi:hypothetical protein